MDKLLFDINFLKDISQFENENIALDFMFELSKKAIGKAEIEFFDIKFISIEDLKKIPKTLMEVVGDKIKFTSEESLCFIYSYYLFNRTTLDSIERLKAFLYEIRKENRKLGHKINQIINANVVILYEYSGHDVSQELLIENKIVNSEYNIVTFPFINSIPYLNFNLNSFIAFLSVFQRHNNSPNIILSVDINESIRKYSKLQPENGKFLLEAVISKNDDGIISVIPNILLGLSEAKGLKSIYAYTNNLYKNSKLLNVRKMALYTLGYFNYEGENDKELLENTIQLYSKIVSKLNLDYLNEIVQVSHYLVKYTNKPINWIEKASTIQNDFLLYNIANFLNRNSNTYKKEEWFKNVLLNLSTANRNNAGIIQQLDFILLSIVDDDVITYIEFLRKWIQNHEIESNIVHDERVAKLFKSSLLEIYRANKTLLEEFITDCFNQNEEKFHITISNIIDELGTYGHKDLTLSEKYLDKISTKETIFIIRKIIGYILGYEKLCVLVFSAIKPKGITNEIVKFIKETFVYYIGYNYPEYTINYIEEILSDLPEKDRIVAEEILAVLRKSEETYKSLEHLKEFETPRKQRLTFNSLKSLEQSRIMEDAREGSLFLSMVNTTILKGGRSSFTKFDGRYTEKMNLGEYKVSMYLPQGEFKDPIGQAILRYRCRIERK